MTTINHALKDNLEEIDEILRECGAESTWIIEATAHMTLTFSIDDHQILLPITNGGTLLVSFFPAVQPPSRED